MLKHKLESWNGTRWGDGNSLLVIYIVLDRRCKTFCSSNWSMVDCCISDSRRNSAVSGWRQEGENTRGRVRHVPEKNRLFASINFRTLC